MYTPPPTRGPTITVRDPFGDMPSLVDNNTSFIPPPPGASQGGQPGLSDAFPGAAQPQNSPWRPPFSGTPYPHTAPNLPPANWGPWGGGGQPPQPTSAASFPFGQQPQYPPFPNAGPPSTPWGPSTSYPPFIPPPLMPNASPFGGGGYPPWSAPPAQPTYTPFPGAAATPDGITAGGFFGANDAERHPASAGATLGWDWPVERTPERKASRRRRENMKRTISADPAWVSRPTTPKKNTPLQRSISFGNTGQGMGLFGSAGAGYTPYAPYAPWGMYPPQMAPEDYGPRNLARRPRDWRADYAPRSKFSVIPNFMGKNRSDVQEYTDPVRRALHPLLQWSANNFPIEHDLRDNPLETDVLFITLNRAHNQIDFAQLTTSPSCTMMRLYHPLLPWYIDVKQSHANGVTVYDVLLTIWRQLMTPVHGRHFYNEELSDEDREVISNAFRERCRGDPGEISRGVCQIDFLGRRVILEGLVKGRNGNWEMKTSKLEPE